MEEIFKGMDEYILTTAEKIRESNEVNLAMWPISGKEKQYLLDVIKRYINRTSPTSLLVGLVMLRM